MRAFRAVMAAATLVGVCAGPVACGPPAGKGGFDSPNPAARMDAIGDAARPAAAGDRRSQRVRPDRELASRGDRVEWRAGRRDGEARRRDRDPIPRLIEQLDSDDPAVRMMAIGALERLTGETLGYRHYDPPSERRAAADRWREAYRAGAVMLQASEDGATDDE